MDGYGYFVRKGIEVAAGAVISPEKRNMRLGSTFPCGRRSPKGRSRWYLVEAPEGREDETCERVRKIVPPSVLQDAFCIRKEHWMKRGGRWSVVESLNVQRVFHCGEQRCRGAEPRFVRFELSCALDGRQQQSIHAYC